VTRIRPSAENADVHDGDVPQFAPVSVGSEVVSDDGFDGGDAACWSHLLCPDCGVVLDGSEHDPTCEVTLKALLREKLH
jgi:hypothetical protein